MASVQKYANRTRNQAVKHAEEYGDFITVRSALIKKHYDEAGTADDRSWDLSTPTFLSLDALRIRDVGDLGQCVNLSVLVLANNYIKNIEPLASCQKLVKLDLHSNQILTLPAEEFWSRLAVLRILLLHNNPLGSFVEIDRLSASPQLTALTLYDTSLSTRHGYRHHVVNSILTLKAFDRYVISDEEIIDKSNMKSTPFASFGANMKIDLTRHRLNVGDNPFETPLKSVWRTLRDINDTLRHCSPVLIIQRWWRGYATRRRLKTIDESLRSLALLAPRSSKTRNSPFHLALTVPRMQTPLEPSAPSCTPAKRRSADGLGFKPSVPKTHHKEIDEVPFSEMCLRLEAMYRMPIKDGDEVLRLDQDDTYLSHSSTTEYKLSAKQSNDEITNMITSDKIISDKTENVPMIIDINALSTRLEQLGADRTLPIEINAQNQRENIDVLLAKSNESKNRCSRTSAIATQIEEDAEVFCLQGVRENFKLAPNADEILEEKCRTRYDIRLSEELYLCMRNEEQRNRSMTAALTIKSGQRKTREESVNGKWLFSLLSAGDNNRERVHRNTEMKCNANLVRGMKEYRDGAKLRVAESRLNEVHQTRLVYDIVSRIGAESTDAQNAQRAMTANASVEARKVARDFEAQRSADYSFAQRFRGHAASCARAEKQSAWCERAEDQRLAVSGVTRRRRNLSVNQRTLTKRMRDRKVEEIKRKSAKEKAVLEIRLRASEELRCKEAKWRVGVAARQAEEERALYLSVGGPGKRALTLPIISTPVTPPSQATAIHGGQNRGILCL